MRGQLQPQAAGAEVFDNGAYGSAVSHIQMLLHQAGGTAHDLLAAQVLLAGLDAQLVWHQRHTQGIPLIEIAENWEFIARRIAGRPPAGF